MFSTGKIKQLGKGIEVNEPSTDWHETWKKDKFSAK